jgi:hypothetical protein
MAATVQGAYFFRNRVRSIPMYIGMSNDFYRPTKIASCAPGLTWYLKNNGVLECPNCLATNVLLIFVTSSLKLPDVFAKLPIHIRDKGKQTF